MMLGSASDDPASIWADAVCRSAGASTIITASLRQPLDTPFAPPPSRRQRFMDCPHRALIVETLGSRPV